MHYVYVIYSLQADDVYYGETANLKRRLKEHRRKDTESTSQAADWRLVYFEAYLSSTDAKRREKKLKQYGSSRGHLKKRISSSIDKLK